HNLLRAIFAMLAGNKVAFFDGALFRVAAFAFEKKFHALAPALPADGTNVSCQVSSPYLSLRCGLQPMAGLLPAYCYTLRFFGGRQPLCGIGVTSLMARTSMPAVESARTADSRPEPGPLTRTSTTRSPLSPALLAAVSAACWAAKGVPLRDPRKPSEPALDHEITFPCKSAMVTIVLLNEAATCTIPVCTIFFSFFLNSFFFPVFAAALAMCFLYLMSLLEDYVLDIAFFLFAT